MAKPVRTKARWNVRCRERKVTPTVWTACDYPGRLVSVIDVGPEARQPTVRDIYDDLDRRVGKIIDRPTLARSVDDFDPLSRSLKPFSMLEC